MGSCGKKATYHPRIFVYTEVKPSVCFRNGKSSLWHFLYKFGRANEKHLRFKGTLGTQAYCVPIIRSKPYVLPDHARPVQVSHSKGHTVHVRNM